MTSSYTTNKAIEKPGYNDYVNSWNTPINADWDIIDKCFGGSYSISTTGGSTSLTQTNVQAVYIIVSGTLGSNATINFPSGVSGFYIIYNGTTGAYTVTAASLGGGNSIGIAQGTRVFAFSDGTNMYYADDTRLTSYVASLSFGTTGLTPSTASTGAIVVSGTLAVANGGTGVTTSTGSGSVVLNTSPTITGPTTVNGVLTISNNVYSSGSSAGFQFADRTTTTNSWTWYSTSSIVRLYSAVSGSLGDKFTFDASGNFIATGNVTAYSDARLKKDIYTIPMALSKVKQLRGVEYTRIDTGEKGTGLIAQDVRAIMPQAVQDGEYLSVAYGNLVGLLVEAIKELSAEVDRLKMRG